MRINVGSYDLECLSTSRLVWSDAGGCELGEIHLSPSLSPIHGEELVGLLGQAVEIYTSPLPTPNPSRREGYYGGDNPAWWGFLNAVEVIRGKVRLLWSLDNLSNRIQVEYIQLDGALAGGGDQKLTGWKDDLLSQQRFGVKELRLDDGWSTNALANRKRTLELAKRRLPWPTYLPSSPTPNPSRREGNNGREIILYLSGWWQRLGWRYIYQDAGREVFDELGIGKVDLGGSAGYTRLAQSFTVGAGGWRGEQAAFLIRKYGAPADTLIAELYTDNAGAPGTLLGAGNLAGSLCSSDYRWESILFGTQPVLTTGAVYWVVIRRSGVADPNNFYRLRCNEELSTWYTGSFRMWNGSAWVSRTPNCDLNFRVWGLAEMSTQVTNIVNYAGSLGTVRVMSTSGEYSNPYMSGAVTCLEAANKLLELGGLRALVLPDKQVLISERPTEAGDYGLSKDGQIIRLDGSPAAPGVGVAGEYLTAPGWGWNAGGDMSSRYVARAGWSPAGGWMIYE